MTLPPLRGIPPVYRYGQPGPSSQPFEATQDDVLAHVERHLGPVPFVFHEIVSSDIQLHILKVDPSAERPFYTLVTKGMSERAMTVPARVTPQPPRLIELMLALPPDWPMGEEAWKDEQNYWPIRLLKHVARMPHAHATWLGPLQTVTTAEPPEPFHASTRYSGVMIANPQLAPEEFQVLERPGKPPIAFYGLVMLDAAEVKLKLKGNGDALFDAWADLDVPINELVNLTRPLVGPPPKRRLFGRRG